MASQETSHERYIKKRKEYETALRESNLSLQRLEYLKAMEADVKALEKEAADAIWQQALGDIATDLRTEAVLVSDLVPAIRGLLEQTFDQLRAMSPGTLHMLSNAQIIQRLKLETDYVSS